LTGESQDCYQWALQTFTQVGEISDHDVKTIITDHQLSLMAAISTVFPISKHQLCTWHIRKNVASKVSKTEINHVECMEIFNKLVVEEDEENSLNLQKMILENYPQLRSYFEGKFKDAERWMAYYTKKYVNFGIATTQLSESMNSSIKNV